MYFIMSWDRILYCRCGMTISYSGMKPTTVELVCLGYHLTKCGNQTLCYSTSKYFLHPFTHYILYCMYYKASITASLLIFYVLQCRRKLRGPLQIKRTHLSWWRGAVGTTCNLSGKIWISIDHIVHRVSIVNQVNDFFLIGTLYWRGAHTARFYEAALNQNKFGW